MVSWVLYSNEGTDVHVRKFALSHTKSWMKKALDAYSDEVQSRFPTGYRIAIDGWECLSNGDDQSEQTRNLAAYFEGHKNSLVYFTTQNIVAAVLGLVCIGLCFASLWALIGFFAAAGFVAFNIYRAQEAFPRRVQEAIDNLGATMREIGEFKEFCHGADRTRDRIVERLEYGFLR